MIALSYRLVILNTLVAFWLIGSDLHSHWMRKMFVADQTSITYLIIALFVLALVSVFWHVTRIEAGGVHQEDIEHIDKMAGWMMMLGLIGTLVGLSFALEGVSVENLTSLEGFRSIAVNLLGGLKTEIGVTIVGAIFSIWAEANYVAIKYRLGKVQRRAQQP